MNIEEKFVVSPRGKTYYWISRTAEQNSTLVFLPGLTADHTLFDRQMEAFSQKHTVLVWDAPGHGKSRPYQDFSYANLAQELKRILDAESLGRVVLVGQSAGGFTAQSFLRAYPSQCAGFVAIDTAPYGPEYYSRSDFFWLRQIEWMAHLYPDGFLRRAMAAQCGMTEYARSKYLAMLRYYSKKELCHLMYLGFAGFLPEVGEMKIPCPVCLILGDHDHAGKIRTYMQNWQRKEHCEFHRIPHAAHNSNEDNPEAVNAVISNFLKRLSPASIQSSF
jgi:pimeloyl-ACP methyl ester carboxylesterase